MTHENVGTTNKGVFFLTLSVLNYSLLWLKHTPDTHTRLINTYKIAILSGIWNVERNPRREVCFHVGMLLWRSNNKPYFAPLKAVASVMFIWGNILIWNLKKLQNNKVTKPLRWMKLKIRLVCGLRLKASGSPKLNKLQSPTTDLHLNSRKLVKDDLQG